MNLQRHSTKLSRSNVRRGREHKSWAFKFYVLIYLLMVASVFFGAVNYRIDLNRKINDLRRASSRAKVEIYELERDIQALKLDKERLCSADNINRCIAAYNLPLRQAVPGQVRYFTVRNTYAPQHTAESQNARRNYSMNSRGL